MKKLLLLLLLLPSLLPAQSIYTYNSQKPNVSCNAVTATGVCPFLIMPFFGGYELTNNFMWQTTITGSPASVSVTLEGAIDNRSVLDASMAASSAVLKSATAAFTAQDVGKTVAVSGVGTAGATLYSTISTYTSATQVSLAASASVSATNQALTIATFFVLDTSTNTAGEARLIAYMPVRLIRCNAGTLSSPGVLTCTIQARG